MLYRTKVLSGCNGSVSESLSLVKFSYVKFPVNQSHSQSYTACSFVFQVYEPSEQVQIEPVIVAHTQMARFVNKTRLPSVLLIFALRKDETAQREWHLKRIKRTKKLKELLTLNTRRFDA